MDGLRCARTDPSRARVSLKDVMQTELYLSCRGTDASDLAKVAVCNRVIGVSITRDVENIEEVRAEADHLLSPNMEVFEQRGVHLPVPRCALGAVMRGTEGKRSRAAVGTNPIVHTARRGKAGLR